MWLVVGCDDVVGSEDVMMWLVVGDVMMRLVVRM